MTTSREPSSSVLEVLTKLLARLKQSYSVDSAAALAQLTASSLQGAATASLPHIAPRAKRVIYLFQSGGPPHLELFDHKPLLEKRFDEDLPPSVRGEQRITGMVSGQSRLALQPSKYSFKQCGQSGQWMSDLLPHTQQIADELCVVRSMNTEAINHDPAITFLQTGSQQPGRPSIGAWLDYGLGSVNGICPPTWSCVPCLVRGRQTRAC